jgi:hypothetical protein
VSALRAAVTNRVLKGGSIIATGSARIARTAA